MELFFSKLKYHLRTEQWKLVYERPLHNKGIRK